MPILIFDAALECCLEYLDGTSVEPLPYDIQPELN